MSAADELWKPLDWDTSFFGFKTSRIVASRLQADILQAILRDNQAWGAEVIHYLAVSDDALSVQLVEDAGFRLVDVRVTLEWTAIDLPSIPILDSVTLRSNQDGDIQELQNIARTSYFQTRYYYDPHYQRDRCDELYAEWISRSCADQAGTVLVAERHARIIGYITCHFDPAEQKGQIGLVGIRADARGCGVGRLLLHAAQGWFRDQGASMVFVVTQGRNIAAQRLYQRSGFVTNKVQLWYHKWLVSTTTEQVG